MSFSHPRLRFFSLKARLIEIAALAAWMGMVHYIDTILKQFDFPVGDTTFRQWVTDMLDGGDSWVTVIE
jgi:hypothetical protein